MRKAIVLLSGGMDSAVTLYLARKDYRCRALIFDYGQKAARELAAAEMIAKKAGVPLEILKISLPWKGSSLLDMAKEVPEGRQALAGMIPDTYVPARNIIFLSFGVSLAEACGAEAVFIGAHQIDFSNYPDCRQEFFEKFRQTVECGTKRGAEGLPIEIVTPIINMTKKEILETGKCLGVPFEHTWSCYTDGDMPCLKCESCLFRAEAFTEAGLEDPLLTKTEIK